MSERLILEIEVPDYNVEGIQGTANELEADVGEIVTEELMRPEVALGLVSVPGEKCLNDEFSLHAMRGLIVGARISSGEEGETHG